MLQTYTKSGRFRVHVIGIDSQLRVSSQHDNQGPPLMIIK